MRVDDESDDVEKDEKVKLIDEEEMGNNKDDDELVEAPKASGTAGMASAMARILGHGTAKQQRTSSSHSTKLPSATSGGTASVVLSRTKTPLQRASEKEKQKEMLQKEKPDAVAIAVIPQYQFEIAKYGANRFCMY